MIIVSILNLDLKIFLTHSDHQIESFPDQKLASCHHGDSWTNKPAKHDDRVSPLSHHKIMLIRPHQALPFARNHRKLLMFNYISKI